MEKESSFDFVKFVEQYRYIIGATLIFLVIILSIILLWRENYFKPEIESRITNQESQIYLLKKEVEGLKGTVSQNAKSPSSSTAVAGQDNVTGDNEQTASSSGSAKRPIESSVSQPVGKININAASLEQLDSLPGIGQTYAKRIIEYRNQIGGFKSIDEIKNVKGIGEATFLKFKEKISI